MNVMNTVPDAKARCNNCGSSGYAVRFPAGEAQINQVVSCTDCGLMYAYPLRRANIETYRVDEDQPLTDDSPQVRHTADKLADYRKIVSTLGSLLPGKGRLIEIGSYSGCLTDLFRTAGWDVIGIEPDARAANYAVRKYDIDIRCGTLETVEIEPKSADAVVMLHVIEHIDDPRAALREIGNVIKPGGMLVVETPSYDSLSFKLLGRRERSLSCDGHIFFYTEATLTDLLKQLGYSIVRVEKVGRTMSIARLLWNAGVILKSKKAQAWLGRVSKRLGLDDRFLYLNLRDMVRIYATAESGKQD